MSAVFVRSNGYFGPGLSRFLRDLKTHNERRWFEANNQRCIASLIAEHGASCVGLAVLADGRIVRGHRGAAASFGWACANPADIGDSAHGWLERHAAGPAFDAIARRAGLADGRALIAAARAGDHGARKGLQKPCAALGAALAGPVAMLGSQSVIVSGASPRASTRSDR
jgi:predicted NBD/HSP70 family sugar kinase